MVLLMMLSAEDTGEEEEAEMDTEMDTVMEEEVDTVQPAPIRTLTRSKSAGASLGNHHRPRQLFILRGGQPLALSNSMPMTLPSRALYSSPLTPQPGPVQTPVVPTHRQMTPDANCPSPVGGGKAFKRSISTDTGLSLHTIGAILQIKVSLITELQCIQQ